MNKHQIAADAADELFGDFIRPKYRKWAENIIESAIEKAYEQGKKDGVREHYVGK